MIADFAAVSTRSPYSHDRYITCHAAAHPGQDTSALHFPDDLQMLFRGTGCCGAGPRIRNHLDLAQAIYTDVSPANACVRLLNATHEIGCAGATASRTAAMDYRKPHSPAELCAASEALNRLSLRIHVT